MSKSPAKCSFIEVYSFFQQHRSGKCIKCCRSHHNISLIVGVVDMEARKKWSRMFRSDAKYYSMPEYTQKEIIKLDPHKGGKLYDWLNQHSKIIERFMPKLK